MDTAHNLPSQPFAQTMCGAGNNTLTIRVTLSFARPRPSICRLGLTRTNVYAGMAGFYLIRERFPSIANGPELPGIPYPAYDGIIPLNLVRELPLALQDRSFTSDSQLWYPAADNPPGSALPNGVLHPRWIPEYTATVPHPTTGVLTNMILWTVNGRTYPRQVRSQTLAAAVAESIVQLWRDLGAVFGLYLLMLVCDPQLNTFAANI